MKKIIIINGPNLNLLGQRETEIYGKKTLKQIEEECIKNFKNDGLELHFFQSNSESEIIDKLRSISPSIVYIEKNCFISSHVVISGGCTIGSNSFLGVNATIRDHVLVGSHNIIGMRANITHDTNDYEVYIEGSSKLSVKSSKDVKL